MIAPYILKYVIMISEMEMIFHKLEHIYKILTSYIFSIYKYSFYFA